MKKVTFLLLLVVMFGCTKHETTPAVSGTHSNLKSSEITPMQNNNQLQIISVQTAHNNLANYLNNNPGSINAFTINLQQLQAIKLLFQANPSATGFRVYLGDRMSVVAIDNRGQDITTLIYGTSSINSGPCPLICDVDSPIMGDNR